MDALRKHAEDTFRKNTNFRNSTSRLPFLEIRAPATPTSTAQIIEDKILMTEDNPFHKVPSGPNLQMVQIPLSDWVYPMTESVFCSLFKACHIEPYFLGPSLL